MKFPFYDDPVRIWAVTDDDSYDLESGDSWHGGDVNVWLERNAGNKQNIGNNHINSINQTDGNTNNINISLTSEKSALCKIYIMWKAEIPADVLILGDHWERGYGDLEFRGIVPERVLPWYFLISSSSVNGTGGNNFCVTNTTNRNHCAAGVMTGCKAFCSWQLTRDSIVLCLDVRNGGTGTLFNGRILDAATVVYDDSTECNTKTDSGENKQYESAYSLMRRFLKTLCPNQMMPSAPVYGGNNWYYAYGNSSDKEIMEDTKLISSLASNNNNRPFMFIDDGWEVCRNVDFCGGPWHEGNYKFPDMPGLCERMKSEGVKPGIWIRPLLNARSFPASWRLPGTRFLEKSLGGEYDFFLDPTVPEAMQWIREDIARLKSWGYDAIKHDYTTYDILGRWGFDMGAELTNPGWSFKDRSVTTMEIILNLYQVIKDAAENVLIIGCNTVSHASAGMFEVARTGDDTSGKEWERTRKMGINSLAFRCLQHGAFYAADADCVGVTPDIPWHLNKQWLDLVARSGTPLLVSIDPRTASEEQKRDVAKAFEIASVNQPLVEPLDWLHTTCPTEYILNGEHVRYNWDDYGQAMKKRGADGYGL